MNFSCRIDYGIAILFDLAETQQANERYLMGARVIDHII